MIWTFIGGAAAGVAASMLFTPVNGKKARTSIQNTLNTFNKPNKKESSQPSSSTQSEASQSISTDTPAVAATQPDITTQAATSTTATDTQTDIFEDRNTFPMNEILDKEDRDELRDLRSDLS